MQLGEDTTTMSMTLNPVNEAAFQKAVQSLETLNRAAVFHPTGTGKSCIAWKVVEAHPQTTFFWLVAGAQRLALRQAELTRYNGGTLPGNVRFCDCEKLAAATPEQWVRLGEQKPGCIVLDCYHELSAVCWAQSVQKLLRMCPQAKVLGLGVPNGAPVCAAAQELFADCIVSHMTVAEAMTKAGSKTPGFRQERPMQQTYRLYGKLRREMEARWEVLCQAAADAAAKEGTLELPRSYTIHSGVPVGKWLELQRQVQAGQRPGRLTAEQAAKLEKLGIRWNHRLEAAWEKGFASAQKYRTEHGDLLVPVRYRDKNDFALGEWIVYNRQRYLGGNLTQNRIERLEAIGMVWSTSNDLWEQNYAAATQYYLEHGDLEVPIKYETPSGFGLGVWLGAQRAAHKAGELPQEQVERLDALGMDWTNRNDRKWMSLYDVAAAYYHEHGNLNVPSEYVTPDGVLLGKWVARQRYAYLNPDRSSARVTPERKALLDKLGMVWEKYDPWQERYDLALAYKTEHGDLEIPSVYKTADGVWLGSWVNRQRQALNSGSSALSSERRKLLRTLFKGERRPSDPAADHGTVREANWERNFRSAARYARKYKHLLVPASYVDSDGVRLGVWISNLRAARKNRPDSYQVTLAHIKKLNSIGMVWDARDAKWGTAYQQAKAYYKAHGNLHAAANYKSDETGFCLGDWLRRMREWDTTHDPKLTPERRAMLDKIGMEWSE